MANTFTLISTTTVGAGGAASIDFNSIPQTYTDLVLVVAARHSGTGASGIIKFNSSTTGYTRRNLNGSGSGVSSNTSAYDYFAGQSDYTANTFGSSTIYIPNYAGSTNKSYSVDGVNENNATGADQTIIAGLWSNTAAITSISLVPNTAYTFVQYSTASLYGILKGSGGATVS